MANIYEPDWDAERDAPPWRWRRAFVGRQAGSRQLGASLFEIAPGAASFQLHAHFHNEELIVVLAGTPVLTTLEGERTLAAGEVVACPAGRAGAHRLDNRTTEPVRVLVCSTMLAPEINQMFEDGDYWVRDYVPGTHVEDPDLDLRLRPE